MNPSEVLATLADWERRYPVGSWRVAGLPAWPVLRLQLGFSLLARDRAIRLGRATPRHRALEVVELLKVARAAAASPSGTLLGPHRADVVFLSQPGNRTKVGPSFLDRYFDPLADALESWGRTSLLLEYHDVDVEYRLPRRRPALLVRPRISLAQARAAAFARLRQWPAPDGYADLAKEARSRHGIVPLSTLQLAERLLAIERGARYFVRLLDVAQPRAVLVSCYYSLVGFSLCLAARRRGIVAVDVQHGVTDRNPAYDGWTCLPGEAGELLPHRFWVWSEADAEPLRRSSLPSLVGGHPFVAYWEGSSVDTQPLLDQVAALRRDGGGTALHVLVALSNTSSLSPLLRRTIEGAPADLAFWVRLHPLLDRDRAEIVRWARGVRGPRVEVEAPTDLPLPLLLRGADVLLAHNSTVLAEAAAAGLPSVAVDRTSFEPFGPQVGSGWVALAEEPRIIDALRSQSRMRATLPTVGLYPPRSHVHETILGLLG